MMRDVKGFLGVYPHDALARLPTPVPGNSLIMNLAVSSKPGTHWVPFYFTPNESLYLDSFGVPPDDRSLDYLERAGKEIVYNDEQLQEDDSEECGYFAMAMIRCLASGMSMGQTLELFKSQPSLYNERLVKQISADGKK
jgi:hypothetical protein